VSASNGIGRSGLIRIGGIPFQVEQQASSSSNGTTYNFAGSLAQFAAGGDWTSMITLVNTGTSRSFARLNLINDAGSDLTLKWESPQLDLSAPLIASAFDRTLEPNTSVLLTGKDTLDSRLLAGSVRLSTSGTGLDAFGIFRIKSSGQEAVVPLETRDSSSYYLPFNNMTKEEGLSTGVAVANLSSSPATIEVVIWGEDGGRITTQTQSITLGANAHTSFMLNADVNGNEPRRFPETDNKRGVVEFRRPSGGKISVLGIRALTANSNSTAITTIPVLADVSWAGGTLSHLAVGGDWETSFTLVNTGSSQANATLSFYGDAGAPLPLPLTVNGTTTTVTSTTQSLPANGSVVIKAAGGSLVAGSALLTTTGNVSGFAVFRFKSQNQEAVVPLELRDPSAFVLPFDNTGNLDTGVAVANLSSQPAAIPITIRDQDGNQLYTGAVNLNARGHDSFMLTAADRFPNSKGRRGVVEFGKPNGGKISILGLRVFNGSAITTIPVSVK
jgi:hypothetical protein